MLNRLSDTRWNCRVDNLLTIKNIYEPLLSNLENVTMNGDKADQRSKAKETTLKYFDFQFVFILHLMIEALTATKILSKTLQNKKMDFASAVGSMKATRKAIADLSSRVGYERILDQTRTFCEANEVVVPDLKSM